MVFLGSARTVGPSHHGGALSGAIEPSTDRSRRTWRLIGAVTLLLSLSFFVPWKPYVIATASIDDSWMLALNALFRHRPRFGHDVVFTYGPWGFLHTRAYHPDTYGLMLAAWTFFAVAFWQGCWAIGRRRISNPAVMLVWMIATLGVAAFDVFHQSATLLCLIGLLLVYWFDPATKPLSATSILLVAAVALASLVKFTYLVAAAMVIVPMAIEQVRRRQVPIIPLLFVAFFLAFDLLAGQRVSDLGDYLRLSMQITSGYTDAMSLTTVYRPIPGMPHFPPIDLLGFTGAGVLLLIVVGRALWQRAGAMAALPLVALGGILFTTFKWGFVRHDAFHTPLAAFVLLFLGLLSSASLWPRFSSIGDSLPHPRPACQGSRMRRTPTSERLALVAVVLATAAVSWDALRLATGVGLPNYYVVSLFGEVGPNLRAAVNLARGTSPLADDYRRAMAAIRSDSPIPAIEGSVDVYPWSPAVAIAAGLNYAPRPVFQSYSAYTEELAALNANHLRGPAAPDHLLLSISDGGFPLDRFPTADDGPSWPEFLSRYNIERTTRKFVVLGKAAHVRHYELTPIGHATARLNCLIAIPSDADGPVWVQVRVEPTRAGKLLALFYKSPELSMSVNTRDGRNRIYRVCAGSAGAGFLLSPLINDTQAYQQLARHLPLPANDVKTITFLERGWIGQGWTYRPNISVSFSRLMFSDE
jgi:hypothetical protein